MTIYGGSKTNGGVRWAFKGKLFFEMRAQIIRVCPLSVMLRRGPMRPWVVDLTAVVSRQVRPPNMKQETLLVGH